MLVQGPLLVPSSPLSSRPRSAGDARDATQSAATSPSVLCVSMTTSGTARCVGDHIAIPRRNHGNPISSFLRARLVSGCRFLGCCRCCSPRRCHKRRTEEGMDNHPTPSEHRADNNHPGQSTTEGSAAEPRIPGDIGRTLGTGRVCDSRRSRVSFGDVAFCQPTDTLDAAVRISHLLRHLVAADRASRSRHPLRSPSRHAFRRSRHQLSRPPMGVARPMGKSWVRNHSWAPSLEIYATGKPTGADHSRTVVRLDAHTVVRTMTCTVVRMVTYHTYRTVVPTIVRKVVRSVVPTIVRKVVRTVVPAKVRTMVRMGDPTNVRTVVHTMAPSKVRTVVPTKVRTGVPTIHYPMVPCATSFRPSEEVHRDRDDRKMPLSVHPVSHHDCPVVQPRRQAPFLLYCLPTRRRSAASCCP